MSISPNYLQTVATILKMTAFYEFQLEQLRRRYAITQNFQLALIFKQLAINNQIIPEQIVNLFSKHLQHINDKELQYLFQIYSSNGQFIIWEDLIQILTPYSVPGIVYDKEAEINENPNVVEEILYSFTKFLLQEVQFFRQVEPLKMKLVVEYKEDGTKFVQLIQDYRFLITQERITEFMLNQQYFFNNDDYIALKRRITLSALPYITAAEFVTSSPLLPYSILIGRTPNYKLVRRVKEEKKTVRPLPLPEVHETIMPSPDPMEFKVPVSTPLKYSTNFEFYTHLKNPPSNLSYVEKSYKDNNKETNYEFNQLKYQDQPTSTINYFRQSKDQDLLSSNANFFLGIEQQTVKPVSPPPVNEEETNKKVPQKKKIFSNLLDNFVSGGSYKPEIVNKEEKQEKSGYFSKKYQSPREMSTPKIKIEDYMVIEYILTILKAITSLFR